MGVLQNIGNFFRGWRWDSGDATEDVAESELPNSGVVRSEQTSSGDDSGDEAVHAAADDSAQALASQVKEQPHYEPSTRKVLQVLGVIGKAVIQQAVNIQSAHSESEKPHEITDPDRAELDRKTQISNVETPVESVNRALDATGVKLTPEENAAFHGLLDDHIKFGCTYSSPEALAASLAREGPILDALSKTASDEEARGEALRANGSLDEKTAEEIKDAIATAQAGYIAHFCHAMVKAAMYPTIGDSLAAGTEVDHAVYRAELAQHEQPEEAKQEHSGLGQWVSAAWGWLSSARTVLAAGEHDDEHSYSPSREIDEPAKNEAAGAPPESSVSHPEPPPEISASQIIAMADAVAEAVAVGAASLSEELSHQDSHQNPPHEPPPEPPDSFSFS